MTDRELLELAAKAAGLKIPVEPEGRQDPDGSVIWWDEEGKKYIRIWNPLKDDGDSLRLAVNLGLDIVFYRGFEEVCATNSDGSAEASEDFGTNRLASTRRAIVRAAAEIGRSMP